MYRIDGRSFDDSDDEKFQQERNQIKVLLEKFDNVEFVLENASLTAALLNYIFSKSHDYLALLYIYIVRKYIRINETKDRTRNYNHINMEIYTTFIHPRSILQIEFPNMEVIRKIEENIDSEDCIIYFNKISQFIVNTVISGYLDKFRETICLGLESYSYTNKIHEDMDRTTELKMLNSLHKSLENSLIRSQKTDFRIGAIVSAMNTQYEYFIFSKKYSYTLKHPESFVLKKTFLSSSTAKSSGKKNVKSHTFEEHTSSRVAFCIVCDIILWGPHPSCLLCQNCKCTIHRDCKDNVKICQGLSDASIINEDKYSHLSAMNNTGSNPIEQIDQSESTNDNLRNSKFYDRLNLARTPSSSKIRDGKSSKKPVKYAQSMQTTSYTKPYEVDLVLRSESARTRLPDDVGTALPQRLKSLHKRSTSEDSRLINIVEPLPVSNFEFDNEMNVPETFEPDIEFKRFPGTFRKSFLNNKGEYQRLLVLMEFHHKTRFIRMTLKRIQYVLVDRWITMDENMELFESLSLNCIDRLYRLIGTLVDVIDSCKGDVSYDLMMAEKVLHWLTDDNDDNLRHWLYFSTDLCCTNILHSVKASWIEHKQLSPRLNELFSIEINRILVIEQLSNMRSLLFNLPMIVTKIVKDLKRMAAFKEEAGIWERVGHKLSHLPQLIDERCMPVVQLVNNGTIVGSSLKYTQTTCGARYNKEIETYVNNFPKTIFKNDFFDFQLVRMSNLREYRHGQQKFMPSAVYVREEVDAAVICYDRYIIILQKENDKYLLKQFKALGANQLFPVIPLDKIHSTKQTGKENKEFQHELTILLIDQAILAQILFKTEIARDLWFDHIVKRSSKLHKNISSRNQTPSVSVQIQHPDDLRLEHSHNSVSIPRTERLETLRTNFNHSLHHFVGLCDLISLEISSDEDSHSVIKRITENGPVSSSEFMIGYVSTLKEYVQLGCQMMDQSKSIDSSLLLQNDILKMNTSKLMAISNQMSRLVGSQQLNNIESDYSDESEPRHETDASHCNCEGPKEEATTINIEAFVDNIIAESITTIDTVINEN